MTVSRPIPEAGPTLSTEEVRKMFEELRNDLKDEIGALRSELGLKVDATQQNVQDLSAQVFNQHVFAKKIELPSSQSNGEDFPLDEPTSKEETTLSINDEEPEVEAGEILDNNPVSKIDVVPQGNEPEDRTEQSIFEAESSSRANDDGEPQVHMGGEPQLRVMARYTNCPTRDVYVDTGQRHGGQGEARLLSLPFHHKRTEDGPELLEFPFQPVHPERQSWRSPLLLMIRLANLMFISEMPQSASPNRGHIRLNYIWCGGIPGITLQYTWSPCMLVVAKRVELPTFINSACDLNTEPTYDEYDENYMLVHLSPSHMQQEFNPSDTLDMVQRDQQMVLFLDHCVIIPNMTMHYDMVVGGKADLNSIRSTRMQLQIILGQTTKMRGGQKTVPRAIPCQNFQVVDTTQLCSTLGDFQQQQSHVGNMTTSRLGVKHWWPPP